MRWETHVDLCQVIVEIAWFELKLKFLDFFSVEISSHKFNENWYSILELLYAYRQMGGQTELF
jgi:hypothetical protein